MCCRFDVGERCWLVVRGDPAEGANCHEVEITDVTAEGITVKREGYTDQQSRSKSSKIKLDLNISICIKYAF